MRTRMLSGVRLASVAALAMLLNACGGGGGGSDGGGGDSTGAFTVSTSSVSFSAKLLAPVPPAQVVHVHLADSSAASIVAGYRPGTTPANWLFASVGGSGLDYFFSLTVNPSALTAGNYSTTLTFATTDTAGNPLKTRDVQISLAVREGIVVTTGTITTGAIAGHSQSVFVNTFGVTGPSGLQWTASTNASWLIGPAGPQPDSGNFDLTVNTAGLPAGSYVGTLTLTNTADSTDTTSVDVMLTLAPPTLTVTSAPLVVGGASGLDSGPVELKFVLGTDLNSHPWTIVPSTSSGGSWLHADIVSGTVSGSGATVQVDADRSIVDAGVYSGQIEVQVSVNGQMLIADVPVSLKLDSNRLLVSSAGVAFSQLPSRQVLTRTLKVLQTSPGATASWNAVSSDPWLAVTASGTTGGSLVLTANPAGLADGQYFATVSVTSPDARIVNQQTVRVGLAVRSTDAVASVTHAADRGVFIVASPVEAVVYSVDPALSGAINVYDVYSGALLRSMDSTVSSPEAITISDDGQVLYVLKVDHTAASDAQVVALDSTTGAALSSYHYTSPTTPRPYIAYSRPDAHPVIITSAGRIIDVATGALFAGTIDGGEGAIAVSPDQRVVFTENSLSPSTITAWGLRYSTLGSSDLFVTRLATNNGNEQGYARSSGQDLAVSTAGDRLYVATGYPYRFDLLDPVTLTLQGFLPGYPYPDSVESCWNGLIAGGADASGNPDGDLWVYDAAGTERARLDSGSDAHFSKALKFSGDGTRLISGSGSGIRIQSAPLP